MAYLKGPDAISKGRTGRKLTPKMRSFIDAYFGEANFVALKAMELSSYKNGGKTNPDMAAQLMRHPLVMAEVERRMQVRTEKSEVKAEFLINKLMEIIADTQQANPTAALRAIELAGKSIALWKERQEISGPDGEAIKHEQRVRETVADFTSRITGLAKRAGTSNVVEFPVAGSDS